MTPAMKWVAGLAVILSSLQALSCGGSQNEAVVSSGASSTRLLPEPARTSSPSPADEPDARIECDRVVDDFSESSLSAFPTGWETRDSDNLPLARREKAFVIVETDGRRALRMRTASEPITIGRGVEAWNLDEYPYLSWHWKVARLDVRSADEATDGPAVTLKVVWLVGLPFVVRQIDYAWSPTLSTGTRRSSRFSHDQMVVLDSGPKDLGTWKVARVDLRRHHLEFFDLEDSEAPTGIALTTNATNEQGHVEAFFSDFRLCRPITGPEDS